MGGTSKPTPKPTVLLKSDCVDIYPGSVTHSGMILAINGVKRGSVNLNIILQSYVQTQEKVKRDSRTLASLPIHGKFFLLPRDTKSRRPVTINSPLRMMLSGRLLGACPCVESPCELTGQTLLIAP